VYLFTIIKKQEGSMMLKVIEKEISIDKEQQIFNGAIQEFLVHGYAGTSMDKVAKAAKVSKATVYSYFQDKEALFKALIEKLASDKFNLIFGGVSLKGEPKVVLRKLAENALNIMMHDDLHRSFMRVLLGESGRFPELGKMWIKSSMKPSIKMLGEYLDKHPELGITDTEATVRVIMGTLVHYMMCQEMMHGKEIMPMESDRLIECLMNMIIK
jgi:TetR/AcrR family transcriptional regulator, regulator of autoinduction and epiphytic fitness